MSSPQNPGPIPPYGTPPAFGTPPPPGSSVADELPTSFGPATRAEPAYRPPAGPPTGAPAGVVTAPAPVATQVPVPGGPPTPAHRSAVGAVRVLGIMLALGMVVLGAGSFLAEFVTHVEQSKFTVTDRVTSLVTKTGTGDVRVRVGKAGDPVTVSEKLRWSFEKPTVTHAPVADGVLTLESSCRSWMFGNCSVDLEVTVPPGTRTDVTTTTGTIHADGQGAPVTARATTGDVYAKADGAPLSAHSTTGDVDVTTTGSNTVDVGTTTGDITLHGDTQGARVTARTTTGGIRVSLTAPPADLSATATTGDISITVPPGGYRVDVETTNGDQTVERGLRDDASGRGITARTTTGDISVSTH